MLETLTLQNFRQHTDLTVNFSEGNTVIRGRNEGGKTTLIEAAMYLMGGSSMCRNNDFVAWGAKPSSCKVTGIFLLGGQRLKATRGKSGAEVYLPHDAARPLITGQTEVTRWFEDQLGAKMDVASKMMFVGQKEITGLLDEKNGKAVEFIEKMSGLDIVDYYIAQIQMEGRHGDTSAHDTAKAAAEERLANLEGSTLSGVEELEAEVEGAAAELAEAQTNADGINEELRDRRQDLANANRRNQERAQAAARLEAAQSALAAANARLVEARQQLTDHAPLEDLEQLSKLADEQLRAAESVAQTRSLYAKLQAYVYPEDCWEGSLAELELFVRESSEAVEHSRQRVSELKQKIVSIAESTRRDTHEASRLEAEADRLEGSLAKDGEPCPHCGQPVSLTAAIIEKNVNQQAQAEELRTKAEALKLGVAQESAVSKNLQTELASLESAAAVAKETLELGQKILRTVPFSGPATYIQMDEGFYPPKPSWKGKPPSQEDPLPAAQLAASRASKALLERAKAAGAVDTAEKESLRAAAAVDDAASKVSGDAMEDVAGIEADITELASAHATQTVKLAELRDVATSARTRLEGLREQIKQRAGQIASTKAEIDRLNELIVQYEFNNDLIDSLRKARPVVANKLWNMVLKSVSSYLTRMRGEPSLVEREGKLFMVNGKPYTSYSGSALDLLGLGIRIALTKVFVPGADMLILDEPFSACSSDRTTNCLSFTLSAGFKQTLVITHEEGTQEVFDHAVNL